MEKFKAKWNVDSQNEYENQKSRSTVLLSISIALLLVLSVTKLSDYQKCIHKHSPGTHAMGHAYENFKFCIFDRHCSMKSLCCIAPVHVTGIQAWFFSRLYFGNCSLKVVYMTGHVHMVSRLLILGSSAVQICDIYISDLLFEQ